MENAKKAGRRFEELVKILDRLRGDDGCPWDKEQNERTIANYFLEEVYEAVEALNQGNAQALAEELGDVLMEVVFLAHIFKEKKKFTIADALEIINKKMIRRHPHVFGRQVIESSDQVIYEWRRQKQEEKERRSIFEGWIKSAPALLESFQIGQRVSAYGFDWGQAKEALAKVKEEIAELEVAMEKGNEGEISEEVGDLLFSLANVSRLLGMNPELTLKQTNRKFIKRFQYIEKKLRAEGKELGQVSLAEMDKIWDEAKDL